MTLYSIEQDVFNFGTMNAGDERAILFALTNDNPVEVTIFQFAPAIEAYMKLELMGIESGNETVLADFHLPMPWKMV